MHARVVASLLALAALLFLIAPSVTPSPAVGPSLTANPSLARGEKAELSGTVVRTVDGDTVWVKLASGVEKVRYIGIDTPEVHHPTRGEEPGGRAATEINRGLVGDRPVRLEPDVQLRDRHGRLLAYVWVKRADGAEVMVNAEMVRLGYAQVLTV